MLASKFRSATRLTGLKPSLVAVSNKALEAVAVTRNIESSSSSSRSTSRRFITTDQEKHFQELGVLDEEGLTRFNTLHELQVNSALVFKDNELFGTYAEESKSYNYITYDEYNQRVSKCRSLLKESGKWSEQISRLTLPSVSNASNFRYFVTLSRLSTKILRSGGIF